MGRSRRPVLRPMEKGPLPPPGSLRKMGLDAAFPYRGRQQFKCRQKTPGGLLQGNSEPETQAGTQASVGQTSAHLGVSKYPLHSIHFSGSIIYNGSPSVIASTGHSGSQTPHATQSSVILSDNYLHHLPDLVMVNAILTQKKPGRAYISLSSFCILYTISYPTFYKISSFFWGLARFFLKADS